MTKSFTLAPTPEVYFGPGNISRLSKQVNLFGKHMLLVTGSRSFLESQTAEKILRDFDLLGIKSEHIRISGEPHPAVIDDAVKRCQSRLPDCVVAIGGGSALDAGKAISAMIHLNVPVKEYLEGVGTKTHPGSKVPFIAIPTTSGTGSEATKNAVISEIGANGYKRSLRHANFVPNVAIIDPELTLSCTPQTTAASGMDAFTQLLESYLSNAANPFTDVLALEGLRRIARSLTRSYDDGTDLEARTDMSWAAYLSGVTLANAGLGIVHGFASPVGAHFNIPHGVVCSALMASANKVTIRKLRLENPKHIALTKYATAGRIFAGNESQSDDYYIDFFLDAIHRMSSQLRIPRLSQFGILATNLRIIIAESDNKNNPVALNEDEMEEVLQESL
jgi:alcohol dehydrogenase class IV